MRIPKTWVLLDNQSPMDVFCNVDLLDNICPAENMLNIRSNGGTTSTSHQGNLPGYRTVWYHPEGIVNILSLSQVKEKYRVSFDSTNSNTFTMMKPDGKVFEFQQSHSGLYYLDTISDNQLGFVHVNTVADNSTKYTNNDNL